MVWNFSDRDVRPRFTNMFAMVERFKVDRPKIDQSLVLT